MLEYLLVGAVVVVISVVALVVLTAFVIVRGRGTGMAIAAAFGGSSPSGAAW